MKRMDPMKAWFPIASLISGFLIGLLIFSHFNLFVPLEYAPYLSVAALVGLDTVFGGVKAGIEGRFQDDIFVSGFILNTLLAAVLVWFGTRIGVDFALVSVLVLGTRIYLNLSLIRRFYLNKRALDRKMEVEKAAISADAHSVDAIASQSEVGGNI